MNRVMIALAVLCLAANSVRAQGGNFDLPRVSPAASLTQRIGITDITIDYHRPGVRDRDIWGGLVPYEQVWRAGANENTTITFTTPVTVGSRQLPAGSYGLHMIPREDEWTVMLSAQNQAWGSFSYDESEDVARVQVTPVANEFVERLMYTFDDPTQETVIVSLRWEELRVSFPINVATGDVVAAYLTDALRGLPRFSWEGWYQAANWMYVNDTHLGLAVTWNEESLRRSEHFSNLTLKANLLANDGQEKQAEELRERAMTMATETELNNYGYQLLGRGDVDGAIAVFTRNTTDHPDSWNVWDSLADAYAAAGDTRQAIANFKKALDLVQDDTQKARIENSIANLEDS